MKRLDKFKLNAKGFGHIELVLIIATIAIIGGIGSYVMLKKSHAATMCSNATTCDYRTWHTVSSTGTISHVVKAGTTAYFLAYSMPRNSTSRVCVTGRSYTSIAANVDAFFTIGGEGIYRSYGTTSSRACGGSNYLSYSFSATVKVHTSNTSFLVQQVDIQRLY